MQEDTTGVWVRRAVQEDAGGLAMVGAATFLETYALVLKGHDIVRHCARAHAASVYEAWMADPSCAVWVAEAGHGVVVGYAVMTPTDLPESREGDLELRRIYVLAPFKGVGAGRRLAESVAGEARARRASRLTLGMYGGNDAALAFYTRVGFSQIATRTFRVGDQICDDLVLGMDL